MHVTVVGAGALGRVYGLRLAAGGDELAFVVRPARAAEVEPFVTEQINGAHRRDALELPARVTAIPARTRVVLVAVRFDQVSSPELVALLRAAPSVPIVVLTPILPKQQAALEAALGRRVTPAMPSVSGYLDERGVVRYWVVRVAYTHLEEPPAQDIGPRGTLEELCEHLTNAGISAQLERDVARLNVATTTAFFPLIAAIGAGGGIDGALADKELFATALDAAKETEALAQTLGRVAPWAHLLTRFIGPYTLKPGVALAKRLVPEAVRFVEIHFGPKLHAQHLAMGEAILELGREAKLAMPALGALMARVRAQG